MEPEVTYGKKTKLTEQETDNTLRLAICTYGKGMQIQMLFEEMSELQNAICKCNRGRDTVDHICEEIADVMIMCMQMAIIYGQQSVEKWADIKMLRLAAHLKGGAK